MSKEDYITIRCYDFCTYTLVYPRFLLEVSKATLAKLMKLLFQFNYFRENEETISFFDRELPQLTDRVDADNAEKITAAAAKVQYRQDVYKEEYLDPNPANMPQEWDKGHKNTEKAHRKDRNAENMRRIKDAKAQYEWHVKQAERDRKRTKEVIEIYQNAKNS